MDQLAKNAIANQDTDDEVKSLPTTFQRYFPSMDGKCSRLGYFRQLWWGHSIPAWYNAEGEMYVGEEAPEGDGWTQDEDVLDTLVSVQHYGHSQQWLA